MVFTAVLGAALLLAQPQPGRTPPVDPDPNTVEGVVVEGRRGSEEERRKAESAFTRGLSAPTRRNRLARWDGAVCPGVVGLPETQAAFIVDRIATEAQSLRLDVGRPGCTPDILILFTSRPDQTAADFRKKYGSFLAHNERGGDLESGGGDQSLETFLTTPRPVRWWHVARLASSDGRPLTAVEIPPGSGRFVPANLTTGASRLASFWKEDLERALVIVDAARVRGLRYEALASYLAMVALAQLDPEAEPKGLPTIMTLFKDRDAGLAPPETLTAYDRAYLAGLYAAPANARSLNVQRGAIRRSLSQVGAAN